MLLIEGSYPHGMREKSMCNDLEKVEEMRIKGLQMRRGNEGVEEWLKFINLGSKMCGKEIKVNPFLNLNFIRESGRMWTIRLSEKE